MTWVELDGVHCERCGPQVAEGLHFVSFGAEALEDDDDEALEELEAPEARWQREQHAALAIVAPVADLAAGRYDRLVTEASMD